VPAVKSELAAEPAPAAETAVAADESSEPTEPTEPEASAEPAEPMETDEPAADPAEPSDQSADSAARPVEPAREGISAVPAPSPVSRSIGLQIGDHTITVEGFLPEGTELKVVKIPEEAAAKMVGKETIFSYDICLMADGQVWQPEEHDADLKVSVGNVADVSQSVEVSILHVKTNVMDGEGNLSDEALTAVLQSLTDDSLGKEDLAGNFDTNILSFYTSSFSVFSAFLKNAISSAALETQPLTAADEENENEDGQQTDNNEQGEDSSENENEETDSSDEDEQESSGNLTAGEEGIVLEGGGEFDVLVAGTLESDRTPILIDEAVTPENVSITVWKIEKSIDIEGEQHVVLEGEPGAEPTVTEDSRAVETAIQYIIRIEPSQEDLIDLEGVAESHGYDVAKETEEVILKITVPDGYNLTGAFNGDGEKIPLNRNDDGDYFVIVPRGGGVYLSAAFEKDSDDDDDDDDDDSDGYSGGWYVEYCSEITFYLNGGILDGDSGPIRFRVENGEEFALLDAPVKPCSRFVRWAPSTPDVHVSAPGDVFVVTHSVDFVAIWEGTCGGNSSVYSDDDDDDDDDDDGPDVTETVRITEDSSEELDLNSVKVEDNPALGIEITASCDIDVDDEVSVSGGDQGATGIQISADGKTVKGEVETGDGMTVTSENNSIGIQASASNGGSLDHEFEGSMDISSDSHNSKGISALAENESTAAIQVTGNVQSDGEGAVLQAETRGKISLMITEKED
jgi:hypothetical protein